MLRNGFGRAFLALIAATLALFLPAESRAACPGTKTCTGCKAAFCDGDVWTCDGFQPQGTACTDNNLCTAGDTCDGAGHCIGGPAVTCTAQDQCHVAGTCNPATGSCSNPIKANG
ncbi:MAG TPA: hypothetical protein VFE90_15640, partial [Myxococcales bacterium]|nr:hypothetical protein [Myxococcales bacterium]